MQVNTWQPRWVGRRNKNSDLRCVIPVGPLLFCARLQRFDVARLRELRHFFPCGNEMLQLPFRRTRPAEAFEVSIPAVERCHCKFRGDFPGNSKLAVTEMAEDASLDARAGNSKESGGTTHLSKPPRSAHSER